MVVATVALVSPTSSEACTWYELKSPPSLSFLSSLIRDRHGLPYDEPVCDVFHNTTLAPSMPIGEGEEPGKCIACILAGVWGSLTAANLE